jgi:ABC-type uncharacterized transport system ATPase subunit
MKAYEVQQFGIDDLALVEQEDPKPAPNEVVVKFHAASLNYRDLMVVTGTYNPRMKLPAVPLSDGAGEVVEVGDAVTKWKVGDRVMPIFAQRWIFGDTTEEKRRTSLGAGAQWDGTLREFGAFDQEGLVRIPEHLSYEEASTLPCAAVTAWHALAVSGDLKAGESVLTLGTGGVSIFALQIAKMFGARIYSTTGSDEKIGKLKELGASEVINYRSREDWDFRQLDGRETLRFFTQLRPGAVLERALALAERLQLDLSRRVAQMSTGMRQKLALVVALAPDVPLVILDEPTANLDPTVRRDVVELIRDVRNEGKTVLFSSHVLSEAEDACDRVIVLRDGRLVDNVRVADVLRQHKISAQLHGELTPAGELGDQLQITREPDGTVTILTAGDLAPVLGWLAMQPLAQLQIEPVGLRAVYERHHPAGAA